MMKLTKMILLIVGCVGLGLGAVGAAVPIMPTFPFLLLAAFCFAKSSQRLNDWFINTKLYKRNLESYISGKGMTRSAKIRTVAMVTTLMSIGFFMMHRVPTGQIILSIVWACHLVYFIFIVKTR